MRDYYICYRVEGVDQEQKAGPYSTEGEAELHQRDISSYEGVSHVYLTWTDKHE